MYLGNKSNVKCCICMQELNSTSIQDLHAHEHEYAHVHIV